LKCEGKWIRETECVNKIIPCGISSGDGRKEYAKKYRQQNKDKIKEYRREYFQQNKDTINEYKKENRAKQKNIISPNIGGGEVAATPK
jgi:hypothetical protein